MSRHSIEGVARAPTAYVSAERAAARCPSDRVARVVHGRGGAVREPAPAGDLSRRIVGDALAARRGVPATARPPSLADVGDAFRTLRTDLGAALSALVAEGSPIHVFGDYDVDGVASCAAMSLALADLRGAAVADPSDGLAAACATAGVEPLVPHRDEGYGLSVGRVATFVADRARAVVCVDNGTNALEALALAASRGLRVLVVDHHPPSPEAAAFWSDRPSGFEIVNPHMDGPLGTLLDRAGWPREVCAAVAVEAVSCELFARAGRRAGTPWGAVLAGLATVTDVMPLHGAGRRLVVEALRACDGGDAPGPVAAMARASLAKAGVGGAADASAPDLSGCALDASFFGSFAGPRLNACGRVGAASDALDFVMAAGEAVAERLEGVERANDARRRLEDEAWEATALLCRAALEASGPAPGLPEVVARIAEGRRIDALSLARTAISEGGEGGGGGVAAVIPGVVAVVAPDRCHPGVAGLLASRVSGALGIPALVLADPRGDGVDRRRPGSGRVPEGSPFRDLAEADALGHAAHVAAAEAGGGGGGHAAAFGLHLPLSEDRAARAAQVRSFAARFAGLALEGLARAVASGRLVPAVEADDVTTVCDLSVEGSRLGPAFARTLCGLGPFGQGHREPAIVARLGPCDVVPIGSGGTFSLRQKGQDSPCKVVGFARTFGGGLADPAFREASTALRDGASVYGHLRQSFWGRGRPSFDGPAPEFILEGILEGVHAP